MPRIERRVHDSRDMHDISTDDVEWRHEPGHLPFRFSHVEIPVPRDRKTPTSAAREFQQQRAHRKTAVVDVAVEREGTRAYAFKKGDVDEDDTESATDDNPRKRRRVDHHEETGGEDDTVLVPEELSVNRDSTTSRTENDANDELHKARLNIVNDQKQKIQALRETSTLLRDELKWNRTEYEADLDQIKSRLETLQKLYKEKNDALATVSEAREEGQAKLNSVEADLERLKSKLKVSEDRTSQIEKDIARKDIYISKLHREGDDSENRIREQAKQLATVVEEVGKLRKHAGERDKAHAGHLLQRQKDMESVHRERERKWKDCIEELEAIVARTGRDSAGTADTVTILEMMARQHSGTSQKVPAHGNSESGNAKLSELIVERDSLQKRNESLEKEIERLSGLVQRSDTAKATSMSPKGPGKSSDPRIPATQAPSPSPADTQPDQSAAGVAYLKLLKVHERLQTENQVLRNQVQELKTGSLRSSRVSTPTKSPFIQKASEGRASTPASDSSIIEKLQTTVASQKVEIEKLKELVETQDRDVERLEELAEIGRGVTEQYGDGGWPSSQTAL